MTTSDKAGGNSFLAGTMPSLYLKTATPIILVMGMNGLLTVVDAYFLGAFVGADALAAVTLMFPLFMIITALATLVGFGLASVMARLLGASDHDRARRVLVGAHGISFVLSILLMAAFWAGGAELIGAMANGSEDLARMGYVYISILIWFSPLIFLLSVHGDAFRSEGKLALMAGATVLVSLANIAFNYLLIVVLDWGVAGSAWGTVFAQSLALVIIVAYRIWGRTVLTLSSLPLSAWRAAWGEILALGAPQSLSFIGIAFGSGAVIAAIQLWDPDGYAATVAAYGIVTRILTFAFLPLMGLNMAMQTIVGNNFGAQLWRRTDSGLLFGLTAAFVYCVMVQVILVTARGSLGGLFVDDAATAAELAHILPLVMLMYFATGPMMVISGYFQAIGDARRALLMSVARTYLFSIPLIFSLPYLLGANGIWLASPAAELLMVVVVAVMLGYARRANGFRWGLLRAGAEPAAA
jgi:putative MATE family efflux protein